MAQSEHVFSDNNVSQNLSHLGGVIYHDTSSTYDYITYINDTNDLIIVKYNYNSHNIINATKLSLVNGDLFRYPKYIGINTNGELFVQGQIAGSSTSAGIYLVHLDTMLNVNLISTYGAQLNPGQNIGQFDIDFFSNGDLLLSSKYDQFGCFMMRLDHSSGQVQWSKSIVDNSSASTGNIIGGGSGIDITTDEILYSFKGIENTICLLLLDSLGNPIWDTVIGDVFALIYDVVKSNSNPNKWLISGTGEFNGVPDGPGFVLQLNNLSSINIYTYNDSIPNTPNNQTDMGIESIIEANNGDIYCIANGDSSYSYILHLDSNFNLIDNRYLIDNRTRPSQVWIKSGIDLQSYYPDDSGLFIGSTSYSGKYVYSYPDLNLTGQCNWKRGSIISNNVSSFTTGSGLGVSSFAIHHNYPGFNNIAYSGSYQIDNYCSLYSLTSIRQYDDNHPINLHPNPTSNQLHVSLESIPQSYQILDLNGKLITTEKVNELSFTLDVQSLPKGMYILQIHTEDGMGQEKFVVE